MPKVWRINLKTGGEKCQEFCLERNIVGVGWPVEWQGPNNLDWETYVKLGTEDYYNKGDKGWGPAVNAMKERMRENDLCWTRNNKGTYFLGRIKSDWRFEHTPEFRNADILNVRDCDWQEVGTLDKVPGKIIRSFIPSRTLQEVHDKNIQIFSQFTYNILAGTEVYTIGDIGNPDLFSFLSPDDCEDLVGCYLQVKEGYMIVPSTCKNDTMDHEYVLMDRGTGDPALVQVKTGYVDLSLAEYARSTEKVYLFTSDGAYTGDCPENVRCVEKQDLLEFVNKYEAVLPQKVQTWVRLMRDLAHQ